MICIACEEKFISCQFLVYKIEDPVCDKCLLSILEARKSIKEYEAERLAVHIEDLKKRIKGRTESNTVKKETEITICDICGEDTKGFTYRRYAQDNLGNRVEEHLIDEMTMCKDCTRIIVKRGVPNAVMQRVDERKKNIPQSDIEKIIKHWINIVKNSGCQY